MSNRKQERDEYLEYLLNATFFEEWRGNTNPDFNWHNSIEFQVSYECNLKCKYCYVNRHGKELYHDDIRDNDNILKNASMLIDWIEENDFFIETWSLFSGSLFSQQIGHDVLDLIYKKLSNFDNKDILPRVLMIPSNFTFIGNEEITEKVEDYIKKFRKLGIHFHFSGSVEGKYMEQNRPFKNKLDLGSDAGEHIFDTIERDDDYYDKVFKFIKKWGFGFHPMIYANDIDKWKDNFLWFQDMFKKYNVPYSKIFLLEVRNPEWSNQQIKDFYEFIKYVYLWTYTNIAKGNKEKFIEILDKSKTINLLYSSIGEKVRGGVPCSMQNDLQVRLGDLHFGPCHRLSYEGLEFGKFKTDEGSITGIEAINVEMATAIYSMNHESFAGCMTCPINTICNKSCLGSNLESTKDPFMVSPKVCQLGFSKVLAVKDILKEIGIFSEIMDNHANDRVAEAYYWLDNNDDFEGGLL